MATLSAKMRIAVAPLRKLILGPVNSGCKPVPTSSRLATRPLMVTRPRVGSMMRLRILSPVDLPAPVRPVMPRAFAGLNVVVMSLNAQNSSTSSPWTICRTMRLSRVSRARFWALRASPSRGAV